MDAEESDPPFQTLRPATFAVVVAVLACTVAVPAAFWLADEGVLPWAEELRWSQLRERDTSAVHANDGDSVELTRGGCFGRCPVYSVKLFASGHVEFQGEAYVCARGRQFTEVDRMHARELLADIAAAGFFELRWNSGEFVADASSSTVTLSYDGQTRSLPDEKGDSNAPRLLRKIEREIDEVAGTARWLPVHTHQRVYCVNGNDYREALRTG